LIARGVFERAVVLGRVKGLRPRASARRVLLQHAPLTRPARDGGGSGLRPRGRA
jgi:hypothetical protein